MEQHSQARENLERRIILEAQIRECFGRVVYSHKTHEKCADILLSRLSKIKLWQIILSAITTAGFIAALFDTGKAGIIIGIIVSTSLLILNAYTKNYDLGEISQKHKQAATDLWLIREKYLSLLTELAMGEKPSEDIKQIGDKPIEDIKKERDILLEDLHSIYSGAPSTTFKAYRKAQDALQNNEELTFSDEEIDAFLPKELRKCRP